MFPLPAQVEVQWEHYFFKPDLTSLTRKGWGEVITVVPNLWGGFPVSKKVQHFLSRIVVSYRVSFSR